MKLNKKLLASGVIAATLFAGNAFGAVSAEEAAKLGDSLTPMGAEKAVIWCCLCLRTVVVAVVAL